MCYFPTHSHICTLLSFSEFTTHVYSVDGVEDETHFQDCCDHVVLQTLAVWGVSLIGAVLLGIYFE